MASTCNICKEIGPVHYVPDPATTKPMAVCCECYFIQMGAVCPCTKPLATPAPEESPWALAMQKEFFTAGVKAEMRRIRPERVPEINLNNIEMAFLAFKETRKVGK